MLASKIRTVDDAASLMLAKPVCTPFTLINVKGMVMLSIKDINRRFFESKLAEFTIENHQLLSAVEQVSSNILSLIDNEINFSAILDEIDSNPKIKHDLYAYTMFGRLTVSKDEAIDVLNDIIDILHQHDNLLQIMHIHALFVYRIFPVLKNKAEDVISLSQFFSSQLQKNIATTNEDKIINTIAGLTSKTHSYIVDRGRIKKDGDGKSYDRIGYILPPFFKNKMTKTDPHIPGETLFTKDPNSNYCGLQSMGEVAFVAGTSGHSLSFIQGVFLYGGLNKEQMKEYALAVFAYLAGGGNHSFHEVMSVMHLCAGLQYKTGEYTPSLPQSILSSDEFYLKSHYRFSHFLDIAVPKYMQKKWVCFFAEKSGVTLLYETVNSNLQLNNA